MIDYFALQLVVTFLGMGTWVTVIAVATEKHGGRLGGFLVGLPSTAAFALFFTGLFVSVPVAVEATDSFPIFMSIIGIFLLSFGYLSARGFVPSILCSIGLWFAASFVVVLAGLEDFLASLVLSVALSTVLYVAFRFGLRPSQPAKGQGPRYTSSLLLSRFSLGGGIVTLALLMGHLGIPILDAMFSAFPALSISTFVAVRAGNKSMGLENAKGMTMSIFVSVMLMLTPFGATVHYLYPVYGVVWGTIAAYCAAAGVGLPYYFFFERMIVPTFRAVD